MTIYTRTGDQGTAGTLAGERRPKTDAVFEACGTIDELSAALGLARSRLSSDADILLAIQRDLIPIGAFISSGETSYLSSVALNAAAFENEIDRLLHGIELTGFQLPGRNEIEAALHLARTVCRRCERRFWALPPERTNAEVGRYLNRLSDLLFALAVFHSGEYPT